MTNHTEVGWKNSSLDRGSIDVLWSSSLTILLCCWVATHPNASSPKDRWYHRFIDKFHLAMIGILGPDFLFGIALGQLSSAQRCVRLFKRDDYLLNGQKWTYQYAFFVDMGGVHLTSPDFPDGFPITGEQLHYLVKYGHVDLPDMEGMAIDERNTTDTLSRLITIWQVLFFSVTEIQRAAKGLPFSTIEVTALSYVIVMIGTSVCWFRKPSITRPRTISTKGDKLIYDIRAEAKEQTHPNLTMEVWYRTPVDFINSHRWGIDAHWSYYRRLSHIMHVKLISRAVQTSPWDRFPSDQWLPPNMAVVPFAAVILVFFSSSFLIAWNFQFPTSAEHTLWRAAAAYHSFFSIYGGIYYLIEAFRWKKRHALGVATEQEKTTHTAINHDRLPLSQQPPCETRERTPTLTKLCTRILRFIRSWKNIAVDQDPEMEVDLRVMVPVTVTCVIYVFARTYLYIEDFISIRSQPAGVYVTVNRFIPFLSG